MHETHQKEQFSIAYIRAVAAVAGFKVDRPELDDDSIDITISSSSHNGLSKSPKLDIQLKATATDCTKEDGIHFSLNKKNYEDLERERNIPIILVVLLIPQDVHQWLECEKGKMTLYKNAYWLNLKGKGEMNTANKTVILPNTQVFTPDVLKEIMENINNHGAI